MLCGVPKVLCYSRESVPSDFHNAKVKLEFSNRYDKTFLTNCQKQKPPHDSHRRAVYSIALNC